MKTRSSSSILVPQGQNGSLPSHPRGHSPGIRAGDHRTRHGQQKVSPKGIGSGIRMIQFFINRAGKFVVADAA